MCVSAFSIIAKIWPCLTLVNIGPTVFSCQVFTTVTSEVISTIHARSVASTNAIVARAVVATCGCGTLTHPVTSSSVK